MAMWLLLVESGSTVKVRHRMPNFIASGATNVSEYSAQKARVDFGHSTNNRYSIQVHALVISRGQMYDRLPFDKPRPSESSEQKTVHPIKEENAS